MYWVPSLPIAVISFLRRDENALYVSDFLDQQASKRRRRCRHLPLDDWNITMYVVFDSASITALSGNMTSCTKPEVLNILQCHQARTENNNVPFLIKKNESELRKPVTAQTEPDWKGDLH